MSERFNPTSQAITAIAPSNIAFIKYWGKRDVEKQWPANDSVSMTLSESKTITTARRNLTPFDSFQMNGMTVTSKDLPEHKVFRHLNRVRDRLKLSGHLDLKSSNTFPMGCGIASSASGFAALTLASVAILTDAQSWEDLAAHGTNRETLADVARLGSGSACRSFFGGFTHWSAGATADMQKITQDFTPQHWNLADIIVVLSAEEKLVSSSQAHLAAWGSPLYPARLAGLDHRLKLVQRAIKSRDLEALGHELESDAIEMHSVAMTGSPQVNYFSPATTKFLAWVRTQRNLGQLPAWFTIDAGPNVHLICDAQQAEKIATLVKNAWSEARVITDGVGEGPRFFRGEMEKDHV